MTTIFHEMQPLKGGKAVCFIVAVTCSFPAGADVHRYKVESPLLQIYPVNLKLTKQQLHAELYALANDMKARSERDFAEFVRISLYEMAGLYEEEARRSIAGESGRSITYRWPDTTMSYANDLYRAADSVYDASELDVAYDDTGELMLIVDGRPYLLSSPVLNKPLLLDQRILDRFCGEIYCEREDAEPGPDSRKRTIVIDADWVIAENRPPEYVTTTGLHFVFTDLQNRSAKQIACLKLIKEMELIADSLRDAAAKGVSLELDYLSIQPLYGSYDHRIRLNRFGDTIYISLPELSHVQDWIAQVWPWVRTRTENRKMELYLQGEVMLSYTLKP